MTYTHMIVQKDYAAGAAAPSGYLAWHEWAEAQAKVGLKQQACDRRGLWKFPQELASVLDRSILQSRKGPVEVVTPVCLDCFTGAKNG